MSIFYLTKEEHGWSSSEGGASPETRLGRHKPTLGSEFQRHVQNGELSGRYEVTMIHWGPRNNVIKF